MTFPVFHAVFAATAAIVICTKQAWALTEAQVVAKV